MSERRSARVGVAIAIALCLALAGGAGQEGADRGAAKSWQRIEAPLALEWPRDHGAHFEHRTEWWYATGELAEAGKTSAPRFGYQLTIFRHGLDPTPPREGDSLLRVRHVFAAHLALVDLVPGDPASPTGTGGKQFAHAERVRRASAGLAGADSSDLRAFVEDWSIARAADDHLQLRASDRTTGIGLALELAPVKPLVLHGEGGISRKGSEPGNASAYASWTRLSTRGTITIGGRDHEVSGESWFDHEWGTSQLGAGAAGWDWYGLRFEDGRELMLYRLRRADGSVLPESAATLVAADGSTRKFAEGEIAIETLSRWKSGRSGGDYPARVRIRIAGAELDLTVAPRAADCELDARASMGVIYWEGPVAVEGSVRGSGYGELTGYAGSLEGKF